MRNQRGFSLIEFLIVVIIGGIIAAIAIPSLLRVRAEEFKSCFGVQIQTTALTADQKEVLQPIVDRRIRELGLAYGTATTDYAVFKALPPAATPQEAQERLAILADITTRLAKTDKELRGAISSAQRLGFTPKFKVE